MLVNIMWWRRISNGRDSRGFSIIELMVVVAILAVLGALAGPSFSEMIASQRVRAGATALYESLILARSEAIKRNSSVALSATSGSFSNGWNVFLADGTTSIRSQEALVRTSFTTTGNVTVLAFNSLGRLSGAKTTISVSGTGTVKTWTVIAEASGRVCVVDGGTTC